MDFTFISKKQKPSSLLLETELQDILYIYVFVLPSLLSGNYQSI